VDSPAGSAGTVQVTVITNGVASSGINYLYDANLNVELTASSNLSFSPVLKNKLTLTGSNFGSIKADLQVVLKEKNNGPLTYVLPVT
jgi:hypothetical protein